MKAIVAFLPLVCRRCRRRRLCQARRVTRSSSIDTAVAVAVNGGGGELLLYTTTTRVSTLRIAALYIVWHGMACRGSNVRSLNVSLVPTYPDLDNNNITLYNHV